MSTLKLFIVVTVAVLAAAFVLRKVLGVTGPVFDLSMATSNGNNIAKPVSVDNSAKVIVN